MSDKNLVLLVGAGVMADAYLDVLTFLRKDVVVVGRGNPNIERLRQKYPQHSYFSAGLDAYIASGTEIPKMAINCVSITDLENVTVTLLRLGITAILVEKPGSLSYSGLKNCAEEAQKKRADVYIAFNRRHYDSVIQLCNLAELDGGLQSLHFDFTELTKSVGAHTHDTPALERWALSNSAHVIDTAFYLAGLPKDLHTNIAGRSAISWHPEGSIFSGCGLTKKEVPFTYHANWQAPGRWSVEAMTRSYKFLLSPMEELLVQEHGSFSFNNVQLASTDDKDFKPGILKQTKQFLSGEGSRLLGITEYIPEFEVISCIAGYSISEPSQSKNADLK